MTTTVKNAKTKDVKKEKKSLTRHLKIGGHDYTLTFSQTMEELGKTIYNDRVILINADANRSIQESTIIHEILHALNSQLDHTLLDSLAEQLYQVLKDNNLLKKMF